MHITRVVVWMLALASLGGCVSQYQGNEKSSFYVVPNGSIVTLNQELTYPPEVVGVYFQHGAIELVPAPVLVIHVAAPAVQHAEVPAEVPQRPAPSGFLPESQAIAHPAQHHRVGRETAETEPP